MCCTICSFTAHSAILLPNPSYLLNNLYFLTEHYIRGLKTVRCYSGFRVKVKNEPQNYTHGRGEGHFHSSFFLSLVIPQPVYMNTDDLNLRPKQQPPTEDDEDDDLKTPTVEELSFPGQKAVSMAEAEIDHSS